MSQEQKLIEKPKVRFCQPSDDSITNSEKFTDTSSETILHSKSNKPRIKSVVTLQKPFKELNKNPTSSLQSNVENIDAQHLSEPICNASSSSPTDQSAAKSQQSLLCVNNSQKDKSNTNDGTNGSAAHLSMASSNTGNLVRSEFLPHKDNLKNAQSKEKAIASENKLKTSSILSKSNNTGAIPKNTAKIETESIPKSKTCRSNIGSRNVTSKAVSSTIKSVGKKSVSASKEVSMPKSTTCKNDISEVNHQKDKTPGKVVPRLSRSLAPAKTGSKTIKASTKLGKTYSKRSPVKKTIMRDVSAHPPNVTIAPGTVRYYPQSFKVATEKEMPHIRPDIISGEKLNRPEYNSIMCTIEQLKKVQAEKIVTDVEHLPLVYKNLINEKVSAALDFPPDEAIYKNLVDLSVNENQLPSRLTRNKNPEPRYKDIVPKLSDFFTPCYSKEYSTNVQIRPSSPEIVSNWSAFAISDKIFGWKHDMDQY